MVQSENVAYVRAHLLPVLRSDEIYKTHKKDPGFVESIANFFNDADERFRKAQSEPTPLFPPTDYEKK
ncbi:MAG: hypothetical protein V1887_01540 [Candidatus Aenigmatarchaeota archaeon]